MEDAAPDMPNISALICREDLSYPLAEANDDVRIESRVRLLSGIGLSAIHLNNSAGDVVTVPPLGYMDVEDDTKDYLDVCVAMQNRLRVQTTGVYVNDLLTTDEKHFVCRLRDQGVECIFYALFIILKLGVEAGPAVLFSAVSYMDRYLSAIIYENHPWHPKEVVLLSVACMSLAYKQHGVNLPTLSLHRLWQVALETTHVKHYPSFHRSTVQAMTDNLPTIMEVQVSKVLDWRLTCHTSYSFLDILLALTKTGQTAASRCTSLLTNSLKDPSFVKFHSFIVAVCALSCVARDDRSDVTSSYFTYIRSLIQPEGPAAAAMNDAAHLEECFTLMKALHRKTSKEASPTSQLPHSNKRFTGAKRKLEY